MFLKYGFFILFAYFITCFNPSFALTSEDFLNSDMAKKRNSREGNQELILFLSNEIAQNSNSYDLCWEYAALWYSQGDLYETKNEIKKECFRLTKDYALKAVALNPSGPDGHYWLGVGYGLWAEANGILDSLFYADDILNEMTKVIEIETNYFRGSAWAVRAKVYNFAPGWPLSIGDKGKSYQDIKTAISMGGDFRFILVIYIEMLMNDGRLEEAAAEAAKALELPYDMRIPREEDKNIALTKKYLETIKRYIKNRDTR